MKQVYVVVEYTEEGETFIRDVFNTEEKALKYIKECEKETGNEHDYFKKEVH